MLFYSMSNQVEIVVNQLQEVIDKIVNKKGEVGVLHVVDQLTQVIQEIQNKGASEPTIESDGKDATSDGTSTSSVGTSTPSDDTPTSSDQPTPIVGPGEVVIITSRIKNSPNELKKDGKVGDPEIINRESIQLS
jgi:hypothetical protein